MNTFPSPQRTRRVLDRHHERASLCFDGPFIVPVVQPGKDTRSYCEQASESLSRLACHSMLRVSFSFPVSASAEAKALAQERNTRALHSDPRKDLLGQNLMRPCDGFPCPVLDWPPRVGIWAPVHGQGQGNHILGSRIHSMGPSCWHAGAQCM